jgi:hypothetical protein
MSPYRLPDRVVFVRPAPRAPWWRRLRALITGTFQRLEARGVRAHQRALRQRVLERVQILMAKERARVGPSSILVSERTLRAYVEALALYQLGLVVDRPTTRPGTHSIGPH